MGKCIRKLCQETRPGTGFAARCRVADEVPGTAARCSSAAPSEDAPGWVKAYAGAVAGVPIIMKAMLEALVPTLRHGRKVLSRTVPARVGEGVIAAPLSALQDEYPDVKMGSYPRMGDGAVRTELVLRSIDEARLDEAASRLAAIVADAHRAAGLAEPY